MRESWPVLKQTKTPVFITESGTEGGLIFTGLFDHLVLFLCRCAVAVYVQSHLRLLTSSMMPSFIQWWFLRVIVMLPSTVFNWYSSLGGVLVITCALDYCAIMTWRVRTFAWNLFPNRYKHNGMITTHWATISFHWGVSNCFTCTPLLLPLS